MNDKIIIVFIFLLQLSCSTFQNKKLLQNYEERIKVLEQEIRKRDKQLIEFKTIRIRAQQKTSQIPKIIKTVCVTIEEEFEMPKQICYEVLSVQ